MAPRRGGGGWRACVRAYGPALPSNFPLNSIITRTHKFQYIPFYNVRFSTKQITTALVTNLVVPSKVAYRKP